MDVCGDGLVVHIMVLLAMVALSQGIPEKQPQHKLIA